jgi:hypothetical protein
MALPGLDPGPVTPTIAQNVTPFWGITSTSNGTFPLSAAFFSDGPAYEGYLCQDAADACFVAGYPLGDGGAYVPKGTVGFEDRPTRVATSGNNYPSRSSKFTASVWNGTGYTEEPFFLQAVPDSGTNAAVGLNVIDPSGNTYWKIKGGQILASQTVDSYSFMGDPTTGMYRDASGFIDFQVTNTTKLQLSSSGASIGGGVTISSSTVVPQIGTPTVGHAACIKSAGPPVVIGYCSTVVDASGLCTCN